MNLIGGRGGEEKRHIWYVNFIALCLERCWACWEEHLAEVLAGTRCCWEEQLCSGKCPCLYHNRGKMVSDWRSRWHVLQVFDLLWQSRTQLPNEGSSLIRMGYQVRREFLASPCSIYQKPIGDRWAGNIISHSSCRLIFISISFFLCRYELLAT